VDGVLEWTGYYIIDFGYWGFDLSSREWGFCDLVWYVNVAGTKVREGGYSRETGFERPKFDGKSIIWGQSGCHKVRAFSRGSHKVRVFSRGCHKVRAFSKMWRPRPVRLLSSDWLAYLGSGHVTHIPLSLHRFGLVLNGQLPTWNLWYCQNMANGN